MYSYIKGRLVRRTDEYIVVENNGIGYQINCPMGISFELGDLDSDILVYLHQNVKEDDISLFGFSSQEQKDLFLQLITVSSVGPKGAMSICSQIKPDALAMAVMNGDINMLTQVKGLGKKTAERIILELRDKLKKVSATAPKKTAVTVQAPGSGIDQSVIEDAISALIVLGYKDADARNAVNSVYENEIGLQDLIKKALRTLVR
ncbi:MAG: Holliday junction branch migration protein RuvA [Clostridia bacterium]|nr:Holliday junction branch migration protein RuvA [Clostridia bacterium]